MESCPLTASATCYTHFGSSRSNESKRHESMINLSLRSNRTNLLGSSFWPALTHGRWASSARPAGEEQHSKPAWPLSSTALPSLRVTASTVPYGTGSGHTPRCVLRCRNRPQTSVSSLGILRRCSVSRKQRRVCSPDSHASLAPGGRPPLGHPAGI